MLKCPGNQASRLGGNKVKHQSTVAAAACLGALALCCGTAQAQTAASSYKQSLTNPLNQAPDAQLLTAQIRLVVSGLAAFREPEIELPPVEAPPQLHDFPNLQAYAAALVAYTLRLNAANVVAPDIVSAPVANPPAGASSAGARSTGQQQTEQQQKKTDKQPSAPKLQALLNVSAPQAPQPAAAAAPARTIGEQVNRVMNLHQWSTDYAAGHQPEMGTRWSGSTLSARYDGNPDGSEGIAIMPDGTQYGSRVNQMDVELSGGSASVVGYVEVYDFFRLGVSSGFQFSGGVNPDGTLSGTGFANAGEGHGFGGDIVGGDWTAMLYGPNADLVFGNWNAQIVGGANAGTAYGAFGGERGAP